MPEVEHGTAADALECGKYGHLYVHYANGRSRPVRGAFLPERRPFTGLTEIIPSSAGQVSAKHALGTTLTCAVLNVMLVSSPRFPCLVVCFAMLLCTSPGVLLT